GSAFVRNLPVRDTGRVDGLTGLRLRIGWVGMVQHVLRVHAELKRFRFRKPKRLAQVRIKPPFTWCFQRKRHVALMSREGILKQDRSCRAVRILESDRI